MIKNKWLLTALLCTVIADTAKADIYLKPTIGIGLGNATNSGLMAPLSNPGFKGCYMGQVVAGYRLGNLRIEAGVGYMTSGYIEKDMLFVDPFAGTAYRGEIRYAYDHIIVPIRAAYRLGIGGRLSIVPHAGLDVSYNLGSKSRVMSDDPRINDDYVKSKNFSSNFRPISYWANIGADVELKVINKLSIVAGPTGRYMVRSIVKDKSPITNPKINNYIISLEAGVLLSL